MMKKAVANTFDSQGRRTEYKSVTNGAQNTWLRFLYDGYLCVQVLYSNEPYNVFEEFVWDPTEPVATRPLVFRYAPNSLNLFYAFDGNKNVSDVFYRMTSNGIGAHYDYAPFGATSRTHSDSSASFDIVALNPFRFSSEYYDSELDLVYYNYRHYSPSLGRFLSRDPIEEQGGLNLYAFGKNKPISFGDRKGLEIYAALDTINGEFIVSDDASEKTIKARANTGGRYDMDGNWIPGGALSEHEIPAPPGKHIIVSEPGDKHEKKDPKDVWFGLFRDDGSLNDKFYDKDRCKKRDGIRLHKGSLSYGCVAVSNGQEKLWSDIVSLIRSTKQGEPIRYGFCCRNKVFRYGTLIITSNNSKSETTSSSEEAEFLKKEKKYR